MFLRQPSGMKKPVLFCKFQAVVEDEEHLPLVSIVLFLFHRVVSDSIYFIVAIRA